MVSVNDTPYRRDLLHIRPLSMPSFAGPAGSGDEISNKCISTEENTVADNNHTTQCNDDMPPSSTTLIDNNNTSGYLNQSNPVLSPIQHIKENTEPNYGLSSPRPKREIRKPSYLKDFVC